MTNTNQGPVHKGVLFAVLAIFGAFLLGSVTTNFSPVNSGLDHMTTFGSPRDSALSVANYVENFNNWGNGVTIYGRASGQTVYWDYGYLSTATFLGSSTVITSGNSGRIYDSGSGAWIWAAAEFDVPSPQAPSPANQYWVAMDVMITTAGLCQVQLNPVLGYPANNLIALSFDANMSITVNVPGKFIGTGLTWSYNTKYTLVIQCLSATTSRFSLDGGSTWTGPFANCGMWTSPVLEMLLYTGNALACTAYVDNIATSWTQIDNVPPTSALSFTPAYGTNYVTPSTSFNISATTDYDDTFTSYGNGNAIKNANGWSNWNGTAGENFQSYPNGLDFCSPSRNGWTPGAGTVDPTKTTVNGIACAAFTASAGISNADAFWALPSGASTSWNMITCCINVPTTSYHGNFLTLSNSGGGTVAMIGCVENGTFIMNYYGVNLGFAPYSANTWYWFRLYWNTATYKWWMQYTATPSGTWTTKNGTANAGYPFTNNIVPNRYECWAHRDYSPTIYMTNLLVNYPGYTFTQSMSGGYFNKINGQRVQTWPTYMFQTVTSAASSIGFSLTIPSLPVAGDLQFTAATATGTRLMDLYAGANGTWYVMHGAAKHALAAVTTGVKHFINMTQTSTSQFKIYIDGAVYGLFTNTASATGYTGELILNGSATAFTGAYYIGKLWSNWGHAQVKGIGFKWTGTANRAWTTITPAWNSPSTTFTMAGMPNGTYTISYCTWDYANNNETLKTQIVKIDSNAPTTTLQFTPAYTNGTKYYVNSSTTFTLIASEGSGETGLAKTYYKWSGSGIQAWTQYTAPFTMATMGNGTYTISWCSWDNVGNNETLHTQVVFHLPRPTLSYTPAYGSQYVTSSTMFTLSAYNGFDETFSSYGSGNTIRNTNGWNNWNATSIDENFESYADGVDLTTASSTWQSSGSVVHATCHLVGGNKVGQQGMSAGSVHGETFWTMPGSQPLGNSWNTMTFKMQSTSSASNLAGVQSFNTAATTTSSQWMVYFLDTGYIVVTNGASNINTITYSAGTWYYVKVHWNNAAYKVWYEISSNGGASYSSYGSQSSPYTFTSNTVGYYIRTAVNMFYSNYLWVDNFDVNWTSTTGYSFTQSASAPLNTGLFNKNFAPMPVSFPIYTFSTPATASNQVGFTLYLPALPTSTGGTDALQFSIACTNGSHLVDLNADANGTWWVKNNINKRALIAITTATTHAFNITQTSSSQYRITLDGTVYGPFTNTGGQKGWAGEFIISATTANTAGSVNIGSLWSSWLHPQVKGLGYKWSGSGTHSWTVVNPAWNSPSTTFQLTGMSNGTYTISYCSWDYANNNETIQTKFVKIDTIAPTTSIVFTPAYTSGPKNWVNTTTSFTLTPTDNLGGSQVFRTYFKWSGSGSHAWTQYTAPFTLAGMSNGTYTISWCSWDNVNNNETLKSQVVYIDTIGPTTDISFTPDYTSGGKYWINSATLITLTGVDNAGGSGVPITVYSWTGPSSQGWTLYTGPFALTGMPNGTYTIYFYSMDNAGNLEAFTEWTVVNIDTIGPTTGISFTPDYTSGAKNWVSDSTLFTLTPNDFGGAGPKATWYKWSGSGSHPWAQYTASFTLAGMGNGTYTISWCSWDNVNNNETLKMQVVYIDTIGPTTGISFTPDYTSGGKYWIGSSTSITLNGADNLGGSGVLMTVYNWTGPGSQTWTLYSGPFALTGMLNGSYTIYFFSMDNAGNIEATLDYTVVLIDMIAPTTTISFTPQHALNYVNWSTSFTLLPSDDLGGSGPLATYYMTDVVGWTLYSAPFTLYGYTNGTHTISYFSFDNVGNVESINTLIVQVAIIGPTVVITSPGNQTYGVKDITITLSCADIHLDKMWYMIKNVSSHLVVIPNKTWTVTLNESLSNGTFLIQAWGNNTYGVIKEATSVYFSIDTSAPQIQLILPANTSYNYAKLYVCVSNLTRADNVRFRYNDGSGWSSAYALHWNKTYWVNDTVSLGEGYYMIQVLASLLTSPITVVNRWITIDRSPPVTSISVKVAYHDVIDYVNASSMTRFTVIDLSPNSVTKFWFDSETTYHVFSAPFSLGSYGLGTGLHNIHFNSTDLAGNKEITQSATVYLDIDAPTTNLVYTPAFAPNFVSTATPFSLLPSDGSGQSGVLSTRYNINGTGWISSLTFTLVGFPNGTITIWYYSTDNVGNAEIIKSIIVRLDTIAPTTSILFTPDYTSGPKNWVSTTTSFMLTPTDNLGGSQVFRTYYKWSGSGSHVWAQYTAPFTLAGMGNGTYTISWCSWDNVNNNETLKSQVVYIDTIGPTTGISFTPVYTTGPKKWILSTTPVTLTANDNTGGSQVFRCYYKWSGSGSPWTQYAAPFTLAGMSNGTYTISWCSWDNAGNNETLNTQVVYIDTMAPSTTPIGYAPVNTIDARKWVSITTTFTLTPADNQGGSQVYRTYYKWSGSGSHAWTQYTAPFSLVGMSNGTYTISWCSWDNVNNNETLRTETVLLDTMVPTTGFGYSGPSYTSGPKTWISSTTTITLTASDNSGGSGIYRTYYKVTGNGIRAWTQYSGGFTLASLGNGTFTIWYCSWDNAGNNETLKNQLIRVDSITPTTGISYLPVFTSGSKNWVDNSTTFTLTANDNTGGCSVKKTYYKWTDGFGGESWTEYTAPFTLAGMYNGTYTISWCSWDQLDNNETLKTKVVFIDTWVPSTDMTMPPADYGGPIPKVSNAGMFTLAANDYNGTDACTTYFKWSNGIVSESWTHYTVPFSMTGATNGTTCTISWCSWDSVGNNESLNTETVLIDAMPPTTTITQPSYVYTKLTPYMKNYTTGSATFSLTATNHPGGSGIGITQYLIYANGVPGSLTIYSGPFTLGSSANGTYTIVWASSDIVGNWEAPHSLIVYIDATVPTTAIVQPVYEYTQTTPYIKNFTRGNVIFSLTPADNLGGSGISKTQYRINGGVWMTGTSFSINSYWGMTITNGTYTISWNSTDNAGCKESTHHLTVFIDIAPPITTIIEPTYLHVLGSKKYTTGSALFMLNPQDNTGGSRIATTTYWVSANGVPGTPTTYTSGFVLGQSVNGTYTILWYSMDNVMNSENSNTLTVYIDTIAPVTTVVYKPDMTPGHVNSSTVFTLTSLDNAGGSGAGSIQYQYTGSGGSWMPYTAPFTLSNAPEGSVTISFRAIDNAGNVEVYNSTTVQLTVISAFQAIWNQYGMIIIAVAGIGVAIIVIAGVAAARKKKKSAMSGAAGMKAMQKGKAMGQLDWTQSAMPGKSVAQPGWIQPATSATLSLEEVRSRLKHLFVFHSRTSVCLFYQPFTEATIDPQLIAGFISAISSFGESFEKEAELKVLEYKNFKVLLEESTVCKYALLFSGDMNDKLNELLKNFMGEFESKFKKPLSNFDGNVSMFNLASDIMASVFKISTSSKNMAFAIDQGVKAPVAEIENPFNLYCTQCQQWMQMPARSAITGSEKCPRCNSVLFYVPICDRCGYKFMKPVTEFAPFGKTGMACEKCGYKMRVQ